MRHLKMYRAIQMIHRSGSIRRAAQELAISSSALNRAIQTFEEELNFTLFQRTASGVALSEAGEHFLHVIERHLVEFSELQRQLARLRDGEVGHLRISVGSDILGGEILNIVSEMEVAYPGVSIDVRGDDGIDGLRHRQVDLALLTNPTTDDAIEVIHVQPIKLEAWHNGSMALAPTDLWELAQSRILLPAEGTGSRTALSHLFRRNRLSPERTSSLPASQVKDYLETPSNIAIFPKLALPVSKRADPVTQIPLELGSVQFCVLRSARVPMTRSAQLFLTLLQSRFEKIN